MGKLVDLTGKRFGRLFVMERGINYVSPKGVNLTTWVCRCDCGSVLTINGGSLKRNLTLSCGCLHAEITRNAFIKDLIGIKFGRLTVLKVIPFDKSVNNDKVRWLCVCDCGNETIVRASDLSTGNTTSCGCYLEERKYETKFNDLKGKIFGRLTILSVDHVFRRTYWNCKCECGESIVTSQDNLTSGKVKSCGCLRESIIASELKQWCKEKFKHVDPEHKTLKNPETRQWLRYDIYIGEPETIDGIYIEINGGQHYKLNGWHKRQAKKHNVTPEEEFEYQKKKDRMKRKYARKNGIYIEVDLRKIKTTEEAIEYIESKIHYIG